MPRLRVISIPATALWRRLSAVWNGLTVPYQLVGINHIVSNKTMDTTDYEALDNEALKGLIETEWTRAKELDDKLQKLTAALSVSITVGGFVGTTMLLDLASSWLKISSAALFFVAATYLLIGAILGFNGLRPKPRWGYGAKFMAIKAAGDPNARKALLKAATESERGNILRSNEADAATTSIRNGVIFFALAVLVSLLAAAGGNSVKKQEPYRAAPIITNVEITAGSVSEGPIPKGSTPYSPSRRKAPGGTPQSDCRGNTCCCPKIQSRQPD